MTNPPRSGVNTPSGSEWRKPRHSAIGAKIARIALSCLCFVMVATVGAATWSEADDTVNVISVENMDALLGLRMVTELKSFEGVKTNGSADGSPRGTKSRYRRQLRSDYTVQTAQSSSSQVYDLCTNPQCRCTILRTEYLNIACNFQNQEMNLRPGSVPRTTHEIRISNAKNLRVLPGTFFDNQQLQKAWFQNVENLTIFSLAFQNLSSASFNLIIEDSKRVTVEDYAFRNLKNPLRAVIANCEHLVLKKAIFFWFSQVHINNVPKLELGENSFSAKVKQDFQDEWSETSMLFMNVRINEIPNATFPISSAKIVFFNCTVTTIRSEAFNGIALTSVSFRSSKIKRVQSWAFSERTLIQNVEFDDVAIEYVDANALSAAARFTVQNCRIEELTGKAFSVNSAYLKLLNNQFLKIRRHAFEIHNWNSIAISGNQFLNLEPNFFSAPFSNVTSVTTEFTFSNNSLGTVEIDVLTFVPNEPGLKIAIENNIFEKVCHCHLETWIRERGGESWEIFYETSYCMISALLENCYNISVSHMNMKQYVEEYCAPENSKVCEDVPKIDRTPGILAPLDPPNTERTVLGVIFLGVLCSIALMITVLTLVWVKDSSFCVRKRKFPSSNSNAPFFSFCSAFCADENMVASNSISRMNIHEYAEIQNRLNHQQKQTALAIGESEEEGEMIECENKATQTLPEELTQELIQSLREKLDDPENYNEARDMIEHLYDLIKVEESCNNNSASPTNSLIFDEEEEIGGIYEVIQSTKPASLTNSKSRRKNLAGNVTSTGTRVPSPDKLFPVCFNVMRPLPTVVSDYTEPKDRKSNEYCELPVDYLIMPDVLTSSQIKDGPTSTRQHIYTQPLRSTNVADRPLPNKPVQPGTSKP